MRYGKSTTIEAGPGGLVIATEEKFYDWSTVHKVTRYVESVKVKDDKHALAEFLKLMDQHKSGEISDFAIECITGKDGQLLRIEKAWTVPDLL